MSGRAQPRPRSDFRYFTAIASRWSDNDMYGHVNNVAYLSFFDTVANKFLIEEVGLLPTESAVIGLVVETGCAYLSALSYPQTIEAGLVVARLGSSSVRYEIGIFAEGATETAAHGHFIHVYVDAKTRRPVILPEAWRQILQGIAQN